MHYELNSGKLISLQEGSLGEILFFRHTELCYIPQAGVPSKTKDLWCFGGSFKAKTSTWKKKKTSEVQLCFSRGTLVLRQATAENKKTPIPGKN